MFIVCKILAEELENRLQETGKTNEYLEIGYSVDLPKKKKEYKKSLVLWFYNNLLMSIKISTFCVFKGAAFS